jgi:uncharacterized membrane protein YdjX (TVP38/TMEM64 family)
LLAESPFAGLVRFAPPELSLPAVCLLLFLDNATTAAATTPLLLFYAPHFEPWQMGVCGSFAAGLGSTVQLLLFRALMNAPWRWVQRLAPSRDRIERSLSESPTTSFLAIVIARATPLPDGPVKLLVAAGRYPLPLYFLAVMLGGVPYFWLLSWLGKEFKIPPGIVLVFVLVVALVFLFERWRKRGRTPHV